MCVPAYRFVQESAQGGQKGALDSWSWGYRQFGATLWVPEQYILLTTEQSPLPLITVQSVYFPHLHIPPRMGDNWGRLDQLCGSWVLDLFYLFTQNYVLYSCKMLPARNTK